VVGYGADPNAVSDWVRAEAAGVVRGNHDRGAASDESLEGFNPAARAAAIWTRRALTEENRLWLESLPRGPLMVEDPSMAFLLAHGSPADEDQYVVNLDEAKPLLAAQQQRAVFFGHTHLQGGFQLIRSSAARINPNRKGGKRLQLDSGNFYLVNPGAVGQPRDGDWRAAYVIFSAEDQLVEYRRVEYDVDRAAEKIRAAGLPEILASRLYEGM
jgi:diadenosine tetraphosphatase ApaH/serine/threonine PP2A family protein phosphatase